MPGAIITGWGICVPDKIVTNEDLSARLDTSDAWITERTGIKQRHIGSTTSELAVIAGRQALERVLFGRKRAQLPHPSRFARRPLPRRAGEVYERRDHSSHDEHALDPRWSSMAADWPLVVFRPR